MQSKIEIAQIQIPPEFVTFMNKRLERNGERGRPNFLQVLAKERNSVNEVLNVLALAWHKNKSYGRIAKKYSTSYHTIYRLIRDLEPFKESLVDYLLNVPRRKVFYNGDLDTSGYETVQAYIRRAKRDKIKTYKRNIILAMQCWRYLKYRDPAIWTADGVVDFLGTKSKGSQSLFLDAIRQVAPQIKDEVRTGCYREMLARRKKDIFGNEVNMITEALRSKDMTYHETIFKLHVTLGARESSTDTMSGMCGLSWDRFKQDFSTVDLYESKVRGGIWWRDCPLTLFFNDLPKRLQAIWEERGKPLTDKIILGGYHELLTIYKKIRRALAEHYDGRLDPSLYKELTTLRPHDADKVHVNLLWEAEIPLEVVAGQYLGKGEGVGLMGRGWLDINTIKKHYLSLTQRSERFKKLVKQVQRYNASLNGNARD